MGETTVIREVRVSYRGRGRSVPSPLNRPWDVARFVRRAVGTEAREHCVAIYLDGRHRPVAWQAVSIGTASATLVHPREVFQPAVAVGAVNLILAHNHPSGDPTPSREDVDLTRRLIDAGKIVGIGVLDHVVVGEQGFVSLRETEGHAIF